MKVNLGQSEFVFDINRLVDVSGQFTSPNLRTDIRTQAEHDSLLAQIGTENASSLYPNSDETSMMQELVSQYLAHEGFMDTAKAFGNEVRTRSTMLRGSSLKVDKVNEEDIHAAKRQRVQ